jgi:hypothetical protein
MNDLITAVEGWLDQGSRLSVQTLVDIAKHLGILEAVDGDAIAERMQRLRALFARYPEPSDALELRCGFAASLATRDPGGAVDQLREQIGKIRSLAELSPVSPSISRMFAEFTARFVGPREQQAKATATVGAAIIAVSSRCPDQAKELLREMLRTIQVINSPNDLAQALADFFRYGRKATAGFLETASNIFSQAVDMAADLPGDSRKAYALGAAIEMYSAFGDFLSAQAVVERLPDEDTRTRAERALLVPKARAEVGELSTFERAFVDVNESEIYWAVLYSIKRSGKTEETIVELGKALVTGARQRNRSGLLDLVRAMLLPARALGGTAGLASIVESVRDFDQRLLEAGRLIGQAQAGQPNGR